MKKRGVPGERQPVFMLGTLSKRKTFVMVEPTYTERLSSGNIDIIENETLKDNIIKYYKELERSKFVIENNNNNFIISEFTPSLLRLSNLHVSLTQIGEVANPAETTNLEILSVDNPRLKKISQTQLFDPERTGPGKLYQFQAYHLFHS